MVKPQGYCKGCKDRTAEDPESGTRDCHRDCKRYKQFKRELAEWYTYIHTRRNTEFIADHRPWLKGVNKND